MLWVLFPGSDLLGANRDGTHRGCQEYCAGEYGRTLKALADDALADAPPGGGRHDSCRAVGHDAGGAAEVDPANFVHVTAGAGRTVLVLGAGATPYTLHPTPSPFTLHPSPYTLHPTPYTLHFKPYARHPTPYTLHSTPYTLNGVLCFVSFSWHGHSRDHPPCALPTRTACLPT